MTNSMQLNTVKGRVKMALDLMTSLTGGTGDSVYLGIGHATPWLANDTLVVAPIETTDSLNQLHRDLVALKLLSISTASLVVQRNDWVANTFVYTPFNETLNMYTTVLYGNANGTVNVSNSTTVIGTNTTFQLDFSNNSFIQLPGDGISIFPQVKEVINVVSNTVLTVNSAFSGNYVSNVAETINNTSPNYAYNFYVRNIYDQVFICLDNNFGTISNVMPQISIGGQLPSNPYIITDDGYKWKYLYTMSAGQKKLFLTSNWMPVAVDPVVVSAATDGRIDIIDVENGGSGYNSNSAACSAPILLLIGDGTGANLTAQVDANGVITDVNILNGGEGYTTAMITANSGANGGNAIINVSIGPRGGWGSNSAMELGATTLMISTSLSDTENGTIPTVDLFGEYFRYRQLSLILNPLLNNGNGNVATNTNYDMTTSIQVSSNPGFKMNDYAYQNPTNGLLQGATFYGTVVWFDESTNELHLNNIGGTGTFNAQAPIYGVTSSSPYQNNTPYVTATAFSLSEPEVETFSGTDLYIENVLPIQRYPLQVEEIRLILSF